MQQDVPIHPCSRSDLTDRLHEVSYFHTDREIISTKMMRIYFSRRKRWARNYAKKTKKKTLRSGCLSDSTEFPCFLSVKDGSVKEGVCSDRIANQDLDRDQALE